MPDMEEQPILSNYMMAEAPKGAQTYTSANLGLK